MFEEYEAIFREHGLSGKEAKAYLTLLSLGPSTAHMLARKSGMVRTSLYDLLKSLKEKGLVSSMTKNKSLFFEAADPEVLIQAGEERKRKLEQALPALKKLRVPPQTLPKMELYDGKEGIKSVYQDILLEKKQLSAVSNTHYIFNTLPFFVPHFIQQRKKKGIKIRLLNEKTHESVGLMKRKDRAELRETRFIKELKEIPMTQYIYGDKVAILSTSSTDPFAMIVRDRNFAKAQQMVFELLWKKAEK